MNLIPTVYAFRIPFCKHKALLVQAACVKQTRIPTPASGLPEVSASLLPVCASSYPEPFKHKENHANREGTSLESHVRPKNWFFPVSPELLMQENDIVVKTCQKMLEDALHKEDSLEITLFHIKQINNY